MEQTKSSTYNDICALILVITMFLLMANSFSNMNTVITPEIHEPISLDIQYLPDYILLTTIRLIIGIIISVIFAIIYATIAAKSQTLEKILIPFLDIMQSVPVLGYISFTVTGFLSFFDGSRLGVECTVIFAIFTAQVWNIIISIYKSFKQIPQDLDEVCFAYNLNKVQKYFKLELPYAIPGIVSNIIVSMSGAWFFIVASEVIVVGTKQFYLPGIGAYISNAILQEDLLAILYAIIAMLISIVIYDQILVRPLTIWSGKFRYESSSNHHFTYNSWCFNLFKRSKIIDKFSNFFIKMGTKIINARYFDKFKITKQKTDPKSQYIKDILILVVIGITILFYSYKSFDYLKEKIQPEIVLECFYLAFLTLIRIVCMMALACIIWVPVGAYIGLKSKNPARAQLISQILASFPANLLFPLFVVIIHHYFLDPDIWLSFLIIFGAQWYILFNSISGSSSIPSEFIEVYKCLNIKGSVLWRKIIFPSIFPQFLTGAFSAWGSAWNATIVAEMVTWGHVEYKAKGIGSFIAEATDAGDLNKVAIGISVIILIVLFFNKFFWQPIFNIAETKFKI